MSNWCVEYWRIPKQPEGSHAQMREQLKYVKPDFKDIGRRYFTDYISATRIVCLNIVTLHIVYIFILS